MALVEFQNNTAPYLNAENLNNNFNYLDEKTQDIYSTDEIVIGKWTDGKPLYRKVYTTTSFIADTFQTITTDSSYDIKMVSGFLYRTNNRVDLYNNVSLVLSIRNTDIEYKTAAAFVTDAISASFIIEYTKTTDEGDE